MVAGRSTLAVVALCVSVAKGEYDPWTDTARYELIYRVDCRSLVATAGRAWLWIPLPRTSTYQRLVYYDVDAMVGFAELTDDFGNRMLYLEPNAAPGRAQEVAVRLMVERRVARTSPANASASGVDDPTRYLGATRWIPLDGPVAALARRVLEGGSMPAKRIREYYDYVVSNLRYSKEGSGWGRGDAVRACKVKSGNCTDFHSLLMGLSRSQGIASRFVIGFPLSSERDSGSVDGYHCWAEVFDPKTGWIPVDASEASKSDKREEYFGTLPSDRVAFTLGRGLTLAPPQSGPPLNYFVYPYAERDGKAVGQLPWSLEFARAVAE